MVTLLNLPDPVYQAVTNATIRVTTGYPAASFLIEGKQYHFSGHVVQGDFRQDHHRVIMLL